MTKKLKKELDSVVAQLVKNYNPDKIILFGSHSKGKAKEDSDLDLVVIKKGLDKTSPHERNMKARESFNSDTSVDVLVYTPYEIKKRLHLKDPFFKSVVEKGRVLYDS